MIDWNEKPSYEKIMLHLTRNVYAKTVSIELHLYTAQYCLILLTIKLHKAFEFIVEDQHQSTTSTSKHIGECSLEKGTSTFILVQFSPAVQCAVVHTFTSSTTRLHHHTTSDCVEWIGHDTGECRYKLGNTP